MKDLLKIAKNFVLAFTILTIAHHAGAQESPDSPKSLKSQYNQLMEYSTYEKYKVIPITGMRDFWANVDDSLAVKTELVGQLKTEITQLKSQIDTLNTRLTKIKTNLDSSREKNDQIDFVGIPFGKTAYHLMVWSIIVILVVLTIIGYTMYMRSNAVTSKARKESETLRAELESTKDKARETQVRLKRELQTAVNTIEEIRRSGARR